VNPLQMSISICQMLNTRQYFFGIARPIGSLSLSLCEAPTPNRGVVCGTCESTRCKSRKNQAFPTCGSRHDEKKYDDNLCCLCACADTPVVDPTDQRCAGSVFRPSVHAVLPEQKLDNSGDPFSFP
jgi:hypothetical protein